MTNDQRPIGYWALDIHWDLELGHWSLRPLPREAPQQPPTTKTIPTPAGPPNPAPPSFYENPFLSSPLTLGGRGLRGGGLGAEPPSPGFGQDASGRQRCSSVDQAILLSELGTMPCPCGLSEGSVSTALI
jgi:hypothetical protein